MRRIYLDHNATTPLLPEVKEAMLPYLGGHFGNPNSIHWAGREAKKAIEEAREKIADAINVSPDEIIFTSSGTEANNLAILGSALKSPNSKRHIITTPVEHSSVLNTMRHLERNGFKITKLNVDSAGMINIEELEKKLTEDVFLVSIMHVNNETGNIYPVEEIGRLLKGKDILFHCDAVQSFGKLVLYPLKWNADFVSLSAHKINGPKGIGALYVKNKNFILPIMYGGMQERGLRAGTENVPGIVGFAKAVELIHKDRDELSKKCEKLIKKLQSRIFSEISGVRLNGHPEERIPTTLNVSFEGVEGESVVMNLDLQGIAVSSGSACSAGATEPSHVLLAMGLSEELAEAAVRFSIGKDTTENDIDYTVDVLKQVISRLRKISPTYSKSLKTA
jgi:cysteine desulfurase